MQETYMYCDIRYETYLNIRCTFKKFQIYSWYIDTVPI